MRAGVLVAIGGVAAVLIATNPATAFNSESDPDSYFGPTVSAIDAHRGWEGTQGIAYEPVDGFTRRMPDDEFDDLLLRMVNRYRSDNGRPELTQFEALRVQSAMWSNRMADAQTTEMVDHWATSDADVACSPVADLVTLSAVSGGRPEDVFDSWVADAGTRNALLEPASAWTGIATVNDGSREWTTMRIVSGTCPGGVLPYRAERTGLPQPRLMVRPTLDRSRLTVAVDRPGMSQLTVEVQQSFGGHWILWQTLYLMPGMPVPVDPPAGQYRVVVPRQSGYDTVFTGLLDVT